MKNIFKFFNLALFLLIFQSALFFAQDSQPVAPKYICISGNCIDGKGKLDYGKNQIYEGDFKNGMCEGTGIFIAENRVTYKGQFSKNLYHGKGLITFSDGRTYEGDWKNDKKNGEGIYKFASSAVYIGHFENDSRSGFGKMTYESGDVYEGNWIDDKRNGKGVMHYKSGDFYDGDWKNDLMLGQGIYKFASSEVYIGNFENDKFNGFGKFTHQNGTAYEGNWKDGLRDGIHKEYVPNNSSNNSSNNNSNSSSYSNSNNSASKSSKKEGDIFVMIEKRRAVIKAEVEKGSKMRTFTEKLAVARSVVILQKDLLHNLRIAAESNDLTEEAKRGFNPIIQNEKETVEEYERVVEKIAAAARKER